VDWKAEFGQLNLAHVAKNKKYVSAHLVHSKSKIREGSPNGTRNTMEERTWYGIKKSPFSTRVGLVGGWEVELPPPVHVYRHPFLSENRLQISILGQNFKHFGI